MQVNQLDCSTAIPSLGPLTEIVSGWCRVSLRPLRHFLALFAIQAPDHTRGMECSELPFRPPLRKSSLCSGPFPYYGKERMIHGRTRGQIIGQPRKFRRCGPAARSMGNIIAQKANRKNTAWSRTWHACGRVQSKHMEAHHITRFDLPSKDGVILPSSFNIWKIGKISLGKPLCLVAHKRPGHQPRALVRTRDELQSRISAHRINTNPHTAIHPAMAATCSSVSWLQSKALGKGTCSPGFMAHSLFKKRSRSNTHVMHPCGRRNEVRHAEFYARDDAPRRRTR